MDIEAKRKRIARIAAMNGWSVAVLAGLCLATSLLWFNVPGLLIGLAAMASGCMELSGRRRLKQNRPEARRWLAGSQLLLLAAVVLYSAYHLLLFQPNEILMDFPPDIRMQLSQIMDLNDLQALIAKAIRILYFSLIVATVLYQGGLWLYYTLATRKLDRAAAESQGKL
jgi:hypothetical protein